MHIVRFWLKGHDVDEGGGLSSSHWIINSTWYLGEMVVDCSFCIIRSRNCKFETLSLVDVGKFVTCKSLYLLQHACSHDEE